MLLYDAFLFLKYKYFRSRNYLEPYFQDLIASKTDFKPYRIKVLTAGKENMKVKNEFNLFKFSYFGLTYELLEDKLTLLKETDA